MSIDLAPGERLLWEGGPGGLRAMLRPADLLLAFIALFVAFFFVALLGSRTGGERQDPTTLLLVGLFPILLVGLLLIAFRVLTAWREVLGTQYALTDRRIVIRGRRREIELELRNLPYLELRRSWLSGPTIYFAERQAHGGWRDVYGGSAAPAFRGVPDADQVYRMIGEARAGARSR